MENLLNILKDELLGFFSVQGLVNLIESGNYSSLRTWQGVTAIIDPLIPLIVVIEIVMAFIKRKLTFAEYRIPFFVYVFNRTAGRFLSLGVIGFCIGYISPLVWVHIPLTWYGFIMGYVVWEFSHFIYHYLAHKVRLLWCLHATHHAPVQMNLSVTYAHFILEAPYADLIRTSICLFFGVPLPMLFAIMFIDGTWGAFIHVGENFLKNSQLGFLEKYILTPSHHRVHHARNPLYIDTNFCNLLNIWDRIFKTYQPEQADIEIEYGITRSMDPKNFWDVYFGELYYLALDIYKAPGLVNKLLYFIMPPGWSHTGAHKTASVMRNNYLKKST
ncbi:MAG: sterol desaturase family protein [Bacteroidetes bacterium]|nr:sterol desaturase family protein [Bacteroidota bacterium]MBS1541612.1 sterol desaturase family protein [Bacteroidota bacterium]